MFELERIWLEALLREWRSPPFRPARVEEALRVPRWGILAAVAALAAEIVLAFS